MGLGGWHAATLALLIAAAPAAPVPEGQHRIRADDPAFRAQRALKTRAETLQEASPNLDTPAETAAWQALYDATKDVRIERERLVHPWAGVALVALAEIADAAGDTPAATRHAQAALPILRPFREQLIQSYVQAASQAGFGLASLGKPSEAVGPLQEVADWYDGVFPRLPEAERGRAAALAKSNIEFALGQALSLTGQNDKALAYQRRSWATRSAGLGPDDPDTVGSHYWVALLLYKAGQREAAEAEARAAVEQALAHVPPAHTSHARALETLGIILSRTGRRSESVGYFQRSIEVKRRTGGANNSNFYGGLTNLADSLTQLERYADAEPLALEAAAGWRKVDGERSTRAANATLFAGLAAAAEGRPADAVARLGGAVTRARGLDAKERQIGPKAIPALIVAERDTGQGAEAKALAASFLTETRGDAASRFALANAELLDAFARDDPGAPAAARRLLAAVREDRFLAESGELPQDQRTAIDLVLRVAVGANDAALALDAAAILAGSAVAQASRLVASRLATADPVLAGRIREAQDAGRTLKAADGTLLKLLASGGDAAAARAGRDAALATLTRLEAGLTRDYPQWRSASGTAAPDLARVQAGLRVDEAVVAIVPAFDGLYTLTVTRRGAAVRRAPLGRRGVLELVTRLRGSLPAERYDTAAAHALYQQFFPATDAGLLRGVTSVRLVPVGPVAQVPFAALLTRPAAAPGAPMPWLIRRFALEVAPTFDQRPTLATAARPAQLLAIGAPTPFGTAPAGPVRVARGYFRGGAADATALAELPPLPATAREIAATARAFGGGQVLQGDDASEARLTSMDLSRFTTVLFATHGLVSGEMEGVAEPALVLAKPRVGESGDGVLTASEIATLRLDADWVILSACNTAAGEGASAPAYSGLAQAFRYAGARALLLSHWPVRDDAATFVTVETVAGARAGLRRPVALQRAMLKLMAAPGVAEAANPYIWAPYILLE